MRESELPNIYVERVDLISQCIYRVWARSRKRGGIVESLAKCSRRRPDPRGRVHDEPVLLAETAPDHLYDDEDDE